MDSMHTTTPATQSRLSRRGFGRLAALTAGAVGATPVATACHSSPGLPKLPAHPAHTMAPGTAPSTPGPTATASSTV